MRRAFFLILFLLLVDASSAFAQSFQTMPRSDLTPGVVRDGLSIGTICRTKWGSDARAVTQAMKDQVVRAYDFDVSVCPYTTYKGHHVRRAEIDHLIARSLGGADDVRNLWPECYEPVNADKSLQANGANKKDRLEKYLHDKVCHPQSPALLKEYQERIAHDWLDLYREIYGAN